MCIRDRCRGVAYSSQFTATAPNSDIHKPRDSYRSHLPLYRWSPSIMCPFIPIIRSINVAYTGIKTKLITFRTALCLNTFSLLSFMFIYIGYYTKLISPFKAKRFFCWRIGSLKYFLEKKVFNLFDVSVMGITDNVALRETRKSGTIHDTLYQRK